MSKRKKSYYAVARGRETGIYDEWSGEGGAEEQVKGFQGALYKGFHTRDDAKKWLQQQGCKQMHSYQNLPGGKQQPGQTEIERTMADTGRGARSSSTSRKADSVRIYTDGGAIVNPGPGGYGVVILDGKRREELSGGRRRTTNNRMELMACIEGLKDTKKRSVVIYSDSRYVINGIEKGWARRWRANGWMRNKTQSAENADLWAELLEQCEIHDVEWVWVKGHAGNRENERCDQLARLAVREKRLLPDEAYESGKTRLSAPRLIE